MKKPILDPLGDAKRDPMKPYTVNDLCRVTGWSRNTVYAALEAGHLPGYRAGQGSRWFVPANAFRALCDGTWEPRPRRIEIDTRRSRFDCDDEPTEPQAFVHRRHR